MIRRRGREKRRRRGREKRRRGKKESEGSEMRQKTRKEEVIEDQ